MTAWALCFVVSYVVSWAAGGCSFTFIALLVFAFIFCVIPAGSTLSSCGFRSQLVGCPFRVAYFFCISLTFDKKQKKNAKVGRLNKVASRSSPTGFAIFFI